MKQLNYALDGRMKEVGHSDQFNTCRTLPPTGKKGSSNSSNFLQVACVSNFLKLLLSLPVGGKTVLWCCISDPLVSTDSHVAHCTQDTGEVRCVVPHQTRTLCAHWT